MWRQARDVDDVERAHFVPLITEKNLARTANDDDEVAVLVLLVGGITAWLDFEIPQLEIPLDPLGKSLSDHAMRADGVVLIGPNGNVLPVPAIEPFDQSNSTIAFRISPPFIATYAFGNS